jgi:hypothetical protein
MVGMETNQDILSSINSFKAISLFEIKKIKLMDRIDLKYIIPINKISELFNLMTKEYLRLTLIFWGLSEKFINSE